jgi:PAS domain S-box-containing protein
MRNSIHNIQNEEYYKLVANNINDLVALYSPAGVLEYVSPSVSRLLGYTVEGLTGLDPYYVCAP